MMPLILMTLEESGVMWTVCLQREERVHVPSGFTLVFVRDWIVGGTRRICWPASTEVIEGLASDSSDALEMRLRDELRRALVLHVGGRAVPGAPVVGCEQSAPDDPRSLSDEDPPHGVAERGGHEMMVHTEPFQRDGAVRERLPNARYAVDTAAGDRVVATLSSELERALGPLQPGTRVVLEVDPAEPTTGRIVRIVYVSDARLVHGDMERHAGGSNGER